MGTVAQAIGIQHEKVRDKLSPFFQTDDTLWSKFEERTDDDVTSYRPYRVPAIPLGAAPFQQSSLDGPSLGLGSMMTTDAGTLVPIVFSQAGQYTKLTELTTKTEEQAVENFVVKATKLHLEQFRERLEAAIQGDGSNTLDTVVAVAGALITVNNGAQFADGQKIDFWSALGGIFRGTGTIYSVDFQNKQLNLLAPVAGVIAGDLALVRGSAAVQGTGVFGLKAFHVTSNVGNWLGVPRTTYPGKLSTPSVNAANQPLTPAIARRSIAALQRQLGVNAAKEKKLEFQMGLDTIAAWENVGITITQNIFQQIKGENSEDMLKKDPPRMFAGRPCFVSLHATPGRVDGICWAHWFRVKWKDIDHYDVAGQTLFPQVAGDGSIMTSMLFYYYIGFNIGMDNPNAGVFINNIPVPAGY